MVSSCNITDPIGSSVLTLKQYASFLVTHADIPSIPVFCVCGIAELERRNRWREIGHQDLNILHESLVENYIPTSANETESHEAFCQLLITVLSTSF